MPIKEIEEKEIINYDRLKKYGSGSEAGNIFKIQFQLCSSFFAGHGEIVSRRYRATVGSCHVGIVSQWDRVIVGSCLGVTVSRWNRVTVGSTLDKDCKSAARSLKIL